jgi:hypothetical protein
VSRFGNEDCKTTTPAPAMMTMPVGTPTLTTPP